MTDEEGLCLSLAELQREMEVLPKLAEKFLSPQGAYLLRGAKYSLDAFKSIPDTDFQWEIPADEPVRTKLSEGHYERKGNNKQQKGPDVVGALNFCWHLRTGPKPVKNVYLVDNATTQLRIYDGDGEDAAEICSWHMDIGRRDSPGCCFHTQIAGPTDWLPVPRLPSFPPTPMSCLEFLVSELFQIGWQQHIERDTTPGLLWRGIQSRRMRSFLLWQLRELEKTTGSPLVHLKGFPDPDILMGA